jgi:hypothetical protein
MMDIGNYSHHKHLTLCKRCGSLDFPVGYGWTQAYGPHIHNSRLAQGQFAFWRNPNAGVAGGPSSLYPNVGLRFGPHNPSPGSSLGHASLIETVCVGARHKTGQW